jgi:PAB1-binding protein PBP1
MAEIVSGVGAGAKRTDQNLSNRLGKINRDAKIQNASGAGYGVNKELSGLAQGAPTSVPTATAPTPTVPATNANMVDMYQPGNPEQPITNGVDFGTPGAGSEVLNSSITGPDQLGILARAMYSANPTPQNRRLLEAFIQEGR